jgi:hypothetical protein
MPPPVTPVPEPRAYAAGAATDRGIAVLRGSA